MPNEALFPSAGPVTRGPRVCCPVCDAPVLRLLSGLRLAGPASAVRSATLLRLAPTCTPRIQMLDFMIMKDLILYMT